jgi:hypothetical protein
VRQALLVAVLTGAAACGYTVVRSRAPFGAGRIALLPFQEEAPVGLSADLSAALSQRLAAGGVQLSHDPNTADAVLGGTILSERTFASPVRDPAASIPAYTIMVRIRAHLLRRGETLWSAELEASETFLPSSSDTPKQTQLLETEANRRRALHRLAEQMARAIHEQLTLESAASEG